jgi:hypothetical protein
MLANVTFGCSMISQLYDTTLSVFKGLAPARR